MTVMHMIPPTLTHSPSLHIRITPRHSILLLLSRTCQLALLTFHIRITPLCPLTAMGSAQLHSTPAVVTSTVLRRRMRARVMRHVFRTQSLSTMLPAAVLTITQKQQAQTRLYVPAHTTTQLHAGLLKASLTRITPHAQTKTHASCILLWQMVPRLPVFPR